MKIRYASLALGAVIPALAVLTWFLVGYYAILPPSLVPSPVQVLQALLNWSGLTGGSQPNMFYSGNLLHDVYATLLRVLGGFFAAMFLGVGFGVLIGMKRAADVMLSPSIKLLGPVPPITIFPVAIVLFGIGEKTNVFLTAYGAFFPILSASVTAVMGVHRDILRAGRMLGHRSLGLIMHVVIPAALPGIVGSLRIGLGLAWMMAVTSEMLAVHSGLGYTLWNAYNYFDYPAVYAAMFVIGFCGLVTDTVISIVTARAVRWHEDTNARSQ